MRLIAQIRARGSVTNRVGGLLGRFAVTAIAVGIAAIIGWQLWIYYLEAPWTRDGRVRADVVQLAADVNVNPTFSWVRLAQRVPVRIALDHVPPDVRLVTGRTATVVVLPPNQTAH